jgi:hypothetical protein
MGIPTWTVGEVLTASDVNTWFVPLAAVKGADTSRTSTTAQTADPHLTLSVAAGSTYRVDLVLLYKGANGAGFFQWDFDVPSGASFAYCATYQNTSGAGAVDWQVNGTSSIWANTLGTAGSTDNALTIAGTLVTAGNAGTFDLKWAQHASNGTATSLLTNSTMIARRLA